MGTKSKEIFFSSGSYCITWNSKYKPLKSYNELPDKVKKDFDYLDVYEHDDQRFISRHHVWYDAYESLSLDKEKDVLGREGWQSYTTDSYSSGAVFKFKEENGDRMAIIGRFYVK